MRVKLKVLLVVFFVTLAASLWLPKSFFEDELLSLNQVRISWAQDSQDTEQVNDDLDELSQKIKEYESKIGELQQEKKSLSSTIAVLNNKILLNEAEITKTEREIQTLELQIDDLSERIEGLELSLGELSKLLVERIQRQYKQAKLDPVSSLLAADGLGGFIKEQRYLQQTRSHTEDLMLTTEYKRQVYDEEKQNKEEKQLEVQVLRDRLQLQQNELAQQKVDKQNLLEVTRNDEQIYQQKLAKALAEFKAIQSIIAGQGTEQKVRSVDQGDSIASIIPGASTCSTGAHLHFEVSKNGAHINPASMLKSASINWRDTAFDFGGSWEWPVNNPAIVTQGYGMTSFARTGFYGGGPHTGIDMLSKTYGQWGVKAVDSGELYRGSIPCGGGNLRYVRVKHSDGISSYYLHVNY